ncbi:MAG: hypothetical protein GY851_14170 [bacterium]|nr:hypothetical protein [bacterium]
MSPSPVGSGARAAGMGDAFVAVADDATAASWNPAGLVQLERPEVAVVGAYNGLWEEFSANDHDEVDSWHSDHNLDLNFLSFTWPLPELIFDRNAVVGVYYQHKYDFSRSFDLEYNLSSVSSGSVINNFMNMDFEQEGALSAISPAFAIEVTKRLSVGVAVNFWRSTFLNENGWEQEIDTTTFTRTLGGTYLTTTKSKEEYEDVHGENVTLGVLWSINDRWSVGARYDSSWTAKANFRSETSTNRFSFIGQSTQNPFSIVPSVSKEPRKIRFPATIALGVGCRVNDRWTLSCDVSRTEWSDFWYKGRNGNKISLVNAGNFDAIWFAPRFEPTYTVRLGTEYVFIPKDAGQDLKRLWSLRGGVFYDQEPASHEPDNFWGLALGAGLLTHNRVNIDVAYQFRYGHDVNSDFIRGIEGWNEDVYQHRLLVSTVIYF